MPANSTTPHPSGLLIHFTEADHRYTDDTGRVYQSVTALVKSLFRSFDAEATAQRISERDGTPVELILGAWAEKRDAACRFGTRVHEVAESVLRGEKPTHKAENEREELAMVAAMWTAAEIRGRGESIQPETVVACPEADTAGCLDLLFKVVGKDWRILDWKTNAEIAFESRYGDRALPPFDHLHDCDGVRYSLQLGIYRWILRREGYIWSEDPCGLWLAHVAPGADKVKWIRALELNDEVDAIMSNEVRKTADRADTMKEIGL